MMNKTDKFLVLRSLRPRGEAENMWVTSDWEKAVSYNNK